MDFYERDCTVNIHFLFEPHSLLNFVNDLIFFVKLSRIFGILCCLFPSKLLFFRNYATVLNIVHQARF